MIAASCASESCRRGEKLPPCLDKYDQQYMVFARLGQDTSFVMSDWNEGISRWRFNLPSGSYDGPYISTAVLDRTLVRAGETVHMKLFYRHKTRSGFRFVLNASLSEKLTIVHQGSDTRYTEALHWDGHNGAEANWQVPKDAKTGYLSDPYRRHAGWADAVARRRHVPRGRVPRAAHARKHRSAAQAADQRRQCGAGRAGELSRWRRGQLRAGEIAQRGPAAQLELPRLRRVQP